MRDTLLRPEVRSLIGRGLFLVVLGAVVLAEAWSVVVIEQSIRNASDDYARLMRQQRQVQADWSRLVLEYGHLSAPVALEKRARRLGMIYRPPAQTVLLYED